METNKVTAGGIATAGLTAAGAGIGAKIGQNRANKILGSLKGLTQDQYVSSRIDANTENIMGSLKDSKWNKAISKITEKASSDFKAITKRAKQEKNKTILMMSAAGLAIGAIATAAVAKFSENKNIEE